MAVGGAVMMLDGNKWKPAKVITISYVVEMHLNHESSKHQKVIHVVETDDI